MKQMLRTLALGAVAALAAAGSADAQPTTLRMAVGAQVTSIDPHYHNISPNNAFATMVFGTLLDTDGNSKLVPGMAVSWKPIADDVWEFKLRPGVTFHNGTALTAQTIVDMFPLQQIGANASGKVAS